ncbi:hypothetical protein MRX96_013968 [Rhipicephalus microplus]
MRLTMCFVFVVATLETATAKKPVIVEGPRNRTVVGGFQRDAALTAAASPVRVAHRGGSWTPGPCSLHRVDVADAGAYRCNARNAHGVAYSETAQLVVHGERRDSQQHFVYAKILRSPEVVRARPSAVASAKKNAAAEANMRQHPGVDDPESECGRCGAGFRSRLDLASIFLLSLSRHAAGGEWLLELGNKDPSRRRFPAAKTG